MTAGTVQRCPDCGRTYDALHGADTCGACGELLDVEHGLEALYPDPGALKREFAARLGDVLGGGAAASGVWRYRELVLPSVALEDCISHPEGNTPLLSRAAVARWAGVDRLLLKHEGHNPTGSFKDRGMTVAITQARRAGVSAVACASTGNTSASLASYASHAGIPAVVFVPAGHVAMGKLAQTIAYGAITLVVAGNFDECLALARDAASALNMRLLNSVNPFRVEGQKSIVFELLQQMDWRAPDWIALPAGNLGNTAAFGKALREAHALGLIDRVPRLAAIQAAGAAPFAASFARQFTVRPTVVPDTVATAIRIGAPASFNRAVRAVRETNGVVLAVTDAEILEAKAVIDASGVGCEPASAASVAGVRALRASGQIADDACVVSVLTGNLLKDPGAVIAYHDAGGGARTNENPPIEIPATVDAVRQAMAQRRR
jgi:threonine synthase